MSHVYVWMSHADRKSLALELLQGVVEEQQELLPAEPPLHLCCALTGTAYFGSGRYFSNYLICNSRWPQSLKTGEY